MKRNNNKKGVTKGIRHVLALVLFCLVMSIGMVCLADEQGTVTVASAKIRASADASSEQLGSVAQGGTVDIIGKTTGTDGKTWYQVYVDANTKGYIRSDLVKVKDGATIRTVDASNASAQNPDTAQGAATAVESKKATVVNSNVRIRKGASTSHDVVATANRGMVVTVTGETTGTDGKKWYQVSFTYNDKEITGFIRSDLVTFENVPADVSSSEITGEGNTEGEEQPETQQPEEQPQEAPQQPSQSNANEVTPLETEELPYVMPGFTAFKLTHEGQEYQAFRNGSFYIIYGQRNDGELGWFLFDSEDKLYARYPYTAAGATEPSGRTVGMLPVIVLVIIVVILAAVVGLLLLKLRENTVYGNGRSYGRAGSRRDDDDDIEDLEDMEDDEDMPLGRPAKRPQPQGQPQGGQPGRRPNPQGGQQPARRPQRENAGNTGNAPQGAAPQGRRPNPQGGGQPNPQGRRPSPQGGGQQQGGQPARRPSPQGGGQPNPQGRRPNPQGGGQSNPQGRRPQPQNEKVPAQKGHKAKNLLEDDDMDFMDI